MISIHNVTKKFGKITALDTVSLDLTAGKSYALIGPNGSGKTTLIKSILGLVLPDGNITVNNETIRRKWQYRRNIGYMPQIGRYPDNMKVGQLFEMLKNIRSNDHTLDEELYREFHLDHVAGKAMRTLSGGTRQKVSAALAFLFSPPILILDEPTAGLDPVSVEILKEKILKEKNSGKLFLITSHIMSDLDDLATDTIYLYEGKIIYNNTIAALKAETGFDRLGKAISKIITQHSRNLPS